MKLSQAAMSGRRRRKDISWGLAEDGTEKLIISFARCFSGTEEIGLFSLSKHNASRRILLCLFSSADDLSFCLVEQLHISSCHIDVQNNKQSGRDRINSNPEWRAHDQGWTHAGGGGWVCAVFSVFCILGLTGEKRCSYFTWFNYKATKSTSIQQNTRRMFISS